MLQRSILCMQGTQYATIRSILCRGAFCGPTEGIYRHLGHCLTRPQLVPVSVSFTRDLDIAHHVAIQ